MLMLNKSDIDRIATAVEARLGTAFTRLEEWANREPRGHRRWQVSRSEGGHIRVELHTGEGHCFTGSEFNLPGAMEGAFREMRRYYGQTVW